MTCLCQRVKDDYLDDGYSVMVRIPAEAEPDEKAADEPVEEGTEESVK